MPLRLNSVVTVIDGTARIVRIDPVDRCANEAFCKDDH